MPEDKKEVMVKHETESPEAVELKAKIVKYEKEIEAHKITGNVDTANAIQREVDNLKSLYLARGGKL